MRDQSLSRSAKEEPSGGAPYAGFATRQPAAPVSPAFGVGPRVARANTAMSISIRPARKEDAASLARYYQTLCPRSRSNRFHGAVNQLPASTIARFADNERGDEWTLLAVLVGGASEAIVGEARHVVTPGGRSAEFALSVADAARGIGIGKRLVQRVMREAAASGVETLHGDVLPENEAMLGLARTLGFEESRSRSDARLRRIERRIDRLDPRGKAPHRLVLEPVVEREGVCA